VTMSLWTTPRRIHLENVFNFAPIREVALLFIGIFATMVPALNYLSTNANDPAFEKFLHTPGQFYYSSGALSSVLDNAPTYLTFLETELGKLDPKVVDRLQTVVKDANKPPLTKADTEGLDAEQTRSLTEAVVALQKYHGDRVRSGSLTGEQARIGFLLGDEKLNWYLVAISLGSVFFGACTYIGNGPNFMVKSIADHAGATTPSFFGYIVWFTLPVLLPTLILVWAIFLRTAG
jgi:Na+/H+ antiporter NhaD/arsenite permease-like protein